MILQLWPLNRRKAISLSGWYYAAADGVLSADRDALIPQRNVTDAVHRERRRRRRGSQSRRAALRSSTPPSWCSTSLRSSTKARMRWMCPDVPDVEESSALERGRKAPLAIRVRTLWRRELRFGSGQFVTQVLGLLMGVAPRSVGLRQGSTQHLLPLVRTFAPPHFGCKALLQCRDQFAEGHDLVGLFLGTWVGGNATLLGDFLSQYTVEAPNRRVACDNRFPQLRLLFLHLQGQFSPLRSRRRDAGYSHDWLH